MSSSGVSLETMFSSASNRNKQQHQNQNQSNVKSTQNAITTRNAVTPETGLTGLSSTGHHLHTTKTTSFNNWQHMTRTIAHYERKEQIGEGTYGQVYKAVCKDSGATVAMKKMRLHHSGYWGMPLQMVREIKILRRLQHPNLLQLIEVVTSKGVEHLDPEDPPSKSSKDNENDNNELYNDKTADARESYKGNLFLVLEYVPHDLTGLMDISYAFTPVQIKCIFRQLLQALQFMHSNKYVHRDIKSSNILLTSTFQLKLADFGLARSIEIPILDQLENNSNEENHLDLTNKVVTLWYRPPEILLGTVHYGYAIDVWSAACILAELCLGKPLFTGKTEVEQLRLIADLLGTPTPDTFEYLQSLKKRSSSSSSSNPNSPASILMAKAMNDMEITCTNLRPSKLRDKYANKSSSAIPNSPSASSNVMPDSALTLLEKLFEWDPRKRLSAAHALEHRYFWTQPVAPTNPNDLGTLQVAATGHFHEFQTKQKRRQAKAAADEAKKEALFQGASQEEAVAKFDSVYRSLMKQVAQEGFSVDCTTKASSSSNASTSAVKATQSIKIDSSSKHEDRKDASIKNSSNQRSRSSSNGLVGERGSRRESDTNAVEKSERVGKTESRDRNRDETHERNKDEIRDRDKNRKRREHRKHRDDNERSSPKRRSDRDRKGTSPEGATKEENSLNNDSDRSSSRRRRTQHEEDEERRKRSRRDKERMEDGDEINDKKDRRPNSSGSHKDSKRRRKDRSGSRDDRSFSEGHDTSSNDNENHEKESDRRSTTSNKRSRRGSSSKRHRSTKEKERSIGENRRPVSDSKDRPSERSRDRDRDRRDHRRGGGDQTGDNDRSVGNRDRDLMPPPAEFNNNSRNYYNDWDPQYRGSVGGSGRPGENLPPSGPYGQPPTTGMYGGGPPQPYGGGAPPPGYLGPPHRWDHRRDAGPVPVPSGGGGDNRESGNGGGGRRDNRDGPTRRDGSLDHYGPSQGDHYGHQRWDGPLPGPPPGGHWDRDGRNTGRRDGPADHGATRRDLDGPSRNNPEGNKGPRRDRDGQQSGNNFVGGSDREKQNNIPPRQDHFGFSGGRGRGHEGIGSGDGPRRDYGGEDERDRNRHSKDSSRRNRQR